MRKSLKSKRKYICKAPHLRCPVSGKVRYHKFLSIDKLCIENLLNINLPGHGKRQGGALRLPAFRGWGTADAKSVASA